MFLWVFNLYTAKELLIYSSIPEFPEKGGLWTSHELTVYNIYIRKQEAMPVLYLVATPIGNLEDISLRAIHILREAALIAAEDTRRAKVLLARYDIKTPLTSYHEHNKKTKLGYLLERLFSEDIALISDAGMPGMSDPGYELVKAANELGITVVPIPGPSAIITALAVSGLPVDRFLYVGFLPRRASSRLKLLKSMEGERGSIVALESPHRLRESLGDIMVALGDRKVAVCRELTKLYEEIYRGNVSGAIEHFNDPRGEFTLVIAGQGEKEKPQLTGQIEKRLAEMQRSGIKPGKAVASIATETGIPRRDLYNAWVRLQK